MQAQSLKAHLALGDMTSRSWKSSSAGVELVDVAFVEVTPGGVLSPQIVQFENGSGQGSRDVPDQTRVGRVHFEDLVQLEVRLQRPWCNNISPWPKQLLA